MIDLDGTLADSAPDIVETANRALVDWAPRMSAAAMTSFIGNGVPSLVRRLLAASSTLVNMDADDAQVLFYRHYRDTNGRVSSLLAGVLDGLSGFQRWENFATFTRG